MELNNILLNNNLSIELTEDECDFLDSIYLPTKYPMGSALPLFYPDRKICENTIVLAKRILAEVYNLIK